MKFDKPLANMLYDAGKMNDIIFMQLYADDYDRIKYMYKVREKSSIAELSAFVEDSFQKQQIEKEVDEAIDKVIDDILDDLTKKKRKR